MSSSELLCREDRMRRSICAFEHRRRNSKDRACRQERERSRDGSSLGGLQARSDPGDDGLVSGQVFRVAA